MKYCNRSKFLYLYEHKIINTLIITKGTRTSLTTNVHIVVTFSNVKFLRIQIINSVNRDQSLLQCITAQVLSVSADAVGVGINAIFCGKK